MSDIFKIGERTFHSRLIVGTGKYKDLQETADAVEASGADIVTVAVRRVNITDTKEPLLMDFIDPKKITYLPNTAGCFNSEDALRTLRLAKESGGWNLVKLEVLGDEKTLYPNMRETLVAAEVLVKEGFEVMVYCSDDPIAIGSSEQYTITSKPSFTNTSAATNVSLILGYNVFSSPKTSSFTKFHPPLSLANLKVLKASSELKHPAVLGR